MLVLWLDLSRGKVRIGYLINIFLSNQGWLLDFIKYGPRELA